MDELKQLLKINKLKATPIRLAILDFIKNSSTPLNELDLRSLLNKSFKNKMTKSTLYREFKTLSQLSLIKELVFKDGIRRYEFGNHHCHHLICSNCSTVTHLVLEKDLEKLEAKIKRNTNFKISFHTLEFYGLCPSCSL